MANILLELKAKYPTATDAQIKELAKIAEQEAKLLNVYENYKKVNMCEFFRPYKWQLKALDMIRQNNVVVGALPNKIGKTCLIALVAYSWVVGYEPWVKSKVELPGYIRVGNYWFKQSSLGKQPPVRIRITGEDWTHHIGETIIPELVKWFPADSFESKKNNQSIQYKFTIKNGSTIELMTHSQDDELFESWLGDGWIPDEPPKKSVYEGMARGLFTTGGKIFLLMTPLSEPWILQNLIEPENQRYDIGVLPEATFLDNEALVEFDRKVLSGYNCLDGDIDKYFNMIIDYENKSKNDHTKGINEHLKKILDEDIFVEAVTKLRALKFVNEVPEDKRDCRLKGRFQSLVGRIYKEYKDYYYPNGHLLKPFKLETDWPVICQVDFHHAEFMVVNFYAFDKVDRLYVIYEIKQLLSAKDISHEIIRLKKRNGWRLDNVYIDPLSKGDDKTLINRFGKVDSSYNILKRALNHEGIILEVGSKDKNSGIDNIRERLRPCNEIPMLLVFDTCHYHRQQFKQWSYKNGKWEDENDHCMETVGRATLTGIKYTDPNEHKKYKFVPDKGVV